MSTRSQARVRTSWSKADAFVPGNRQRQISPGERENQLHIHRSDNLLTVFSVIRLAGLERVREQSPEEYSQLHTNTAAQHMRAPASSIQAPRLSLSWASAALDPGVSVAAGAIWSAEEQRSPPGLSETSHLRKKPSQQGGGRTSSPTFQQGPQNGNVDVLVLLGADVEHRDLQRHKMAASSHRHPPRPHSC